MTFECEGTRARENSPNGYRLTLVFGVVSKRLERLAAASSLWLALLVACGNSDHHGADAMVDPGLAQQAYVKASNTGAYDSFGGSVALSADGSTLAVVAPSESSAATGINGDQADNSASGAGAVYVFTRTGTTWTQQAYVKASNTDALDVFGGFDGAVALSADGSTLAVGAPGESSAATGIDGNQADNSAKLAGAVYVFARSGTTWSQQAYVKASNTDAQDLFGSSVALSADGSTLAVGAAGESSGAAGIGGNQADNSAMGAGAVYVFTRSATTWTQQAYIKASNPDVNDSFGECVAVAADGNTLAVGTPSEASAATGIDGNQADNSAMSAGAVYVFTRSGTAWTQQAYVKASNTRAGGIFGDSPVLSADGNLLAVGAQSESSAATGVDGNQADTSAPHAGAVYVFSRSGTTWTQQAYVKASNAGIGDHFGYHVAMSGDGAALAVGAADEASDAIGIDGNQADNSAPSAGAVYTFVRSGTSWIQKAYVKAPNNGASAGCSPLPGRPCPIDFGGSVAVSADNSTLAIGAFTDASAATGIDGNQADNTARASGAVWVFAAQ